MTFSFLFLVSRQRRDFEKFSLIVERIFACPAEAIERRRRAKKTDYLALANNSLFQNACQVAHVDKISVIFDPTTPHPLPHPTRS